MSEVRPQRLAAGYFLGFVVAVFLVFAWLRGAGRLLIPLLLGGLVVVVITRVVRKIREPLP